MPVVMFNGTADPVVPYRGGQVGLTGSYGEVWSAERTAAFLAWGNGCARHVERALGGSDGAAIRVTRLDWSSCSSGQPVILYRVEGGGHQVFGSTNIVPLILGPAPARCPHPRRSWRCSQRGDREGASRLGQPGLAQALEVEVVHPRVAEAREPRAGARGVRLVLQH